MAILRHKDEQDTVVLPPTALVGRSRRADVLLRQPCGSAVHASLRWTGWDWEIHDHGSRNGTRVNGATIEPGQPRRLAHGATLEFGASAEQWVLVDSGPPGPFATASDGTLALGEGDLLALPKPDQSEATVYRTAQGDWVFEDCSDTRSIDDRAQVRAGGLVWTVRLPLSTERTAGKDADGSARSLDDLHLHFRVSRDEEEVDVWVEGQGDSKALTSRAHSYLLLTLARQRLQDAKILPNGECGWLDREVVAHMLAMDANHLYVAVYRARRQFAEAGIPDAARIVEWKPGRGKLRIGCGNLTVERP
jgi:hypothetical protein